jgi:RNA polymerase sigma-70 factor (ECF subfamily)
MSSAEGEPADSGQPIQDNNPPGDPTANTKPSRNMAESDIVEALRAGDEEAFTALVERYSSAMLRIAWAYVSTKSAAEDVVQETWLVALSAIHRFEGLSSLRTWLFGILLNVARARRMKDQRDVPFSAIFPEEAGPVVDPERFLPPDHAEAPHHWATPPRHWSVPDTVLLSSEVRVEIRRALDSLPPRQAAIVSLHDIQGYSVAEICDFLAISAGNARVLLHRGRAGIREKIEKYLDDMDSQP